MATGLGLASKTVVVQGLNPITTDDTIEYYFCNKKRSGGGPVQSVQRSADQTQACVTFENCADAESVTKKVGLTLDKHALRTQFLEAAKEQQCIAGNDSQETMQRDDEELTGTPVLFAAGCNVNENATVSAASKPNRSRLRHQTFPQIPVDQSRPETEPQPRRSQPPSRHIQLSFSSGVVERIVHDSQLLRRLVQELKAVNGKFQWEPPHDIIVKCLLPDAPEDWETNVVDIVNKFIKKVQTSQTASKAEDTTSNIFPSGLSGTREVLIKVDSKVMQRVIGDPGLLRELSTNMKKVDGRFRWKQPDHIIIKCTSQNAAGSWEEKVKAELRRFINKVQLTLLNKSKCASHPAESAFNSDSNASAKLSTAEEIITNLKPAQIKSLSIPQVLRGLQASYKSLRVEVDKKNNTAKVQCPEEVMKKAFADVLSLVQLFRENRIPLSPAVIKMFKKEDAREWVQARVVEHNQLLCHWEVSETHLIICGQSAVLDIIGNYFKEIFSEKAVDVDDKEMQVVRSPAWQEFLEEIENEDRCGYPTPVLLPEKKKIIIVDTPSNIEKTHRKLREFLEKNQAGKRTFSTGTPKTFQHQYSHQLAFQSQPTQNIYPRAQLQIQHRPQDAHTEASDARHLRMIKVSGPKLCAETEDLCELYFENKKKSGGGEIEEEGGVIWDEQQRCFFITFKDRGIAEAVAGREHQMKDSPLYALLCSSPSLLYNTKISQSTTTTPYRHNRPPTADAKGFRHTSTAGSDVVPTLRSSSSAKSVLVKGVPRGTTNDCLQNYLEFATDLSVQSISPGQDEYTSLVTFDSSETVDLEKIQNACKEQPFNGDVKMTFQPATAYDTIIIKGLKPTTADDAIKLFFSNKRRNDGGPVKGVERSTDRTEAVVCYENASDAASVVKKGSHSLDGNDLSVAFQTSSSSPFVSPGGVSSRRKVQIEVSSKIIQRIVSDPDLFRQLLANMNKIAGKFRWKQPDHVLILCTSESAPQNWEERAQLEIQRFVDKVQSTVLNERQHARSATKSPPGQPIPNKNSSRTNQNLSVSDSKASSEVVMAEETVFSLNPAQLKGLSIPSVLENLQTLHKGLQVKVDGDARTAKVCGRKEIIEKAFADQLDILHKFREVRIPVSNAMVRMFQKSDARDWIQANVERNGLVCNWEVSETYLVISGQRGNLQYLGQHFRDIFCEKAFDLDEREIQMVRSPAWARFTTEMEKERVGFPIPVLLPTENQLIIVDIPFNMKRTLGKLQGFFDNNQYYLYC